VLCASRSDEVQPQSQKIGLKEFEQ
jgi:hypothetical protein